MASKCASVLRKSRSTLTLEDFFMTSYGQTPRQVKDDFRHYKRTGQIR
jgi:hypothetical protein